MLDEFTANHLQRWLDSSVHVTERVEVRNNILRLIADDPALLDTHSWDEIRRLSEC